MQRRSFIKNSSLAGLSLTASSILLSQRQIEPTLLVDRFELDEVTIDDLQKRMKLGELTSKSITQKYLKRIDELNQKGPKLRAVIEVNPDAEMIAAALDNERKAGKMRGPMHGIPVLVKDNINTGDKMMTTAGTLALQGNKAKEDAFIIRQLRAAGAVILGKSNLSEWSNFRSSRASSGWSSRGGQTKNPYVLDRTPSGSSSGSAAGVAANLCAGAIGTETNGSIVSPASHMGVVGLKPTTGLLSRSGIIPISKTQDTAGPIARTVKDVAILLGVLTGTDENDHLSIEAKGKAMAYYTEQLDTNALRGKKIGVEQSFFKGHPNVVKLYEEAINLLMQQGATIIHVELLSTFGKLDYASYNLMLYEFKEGIANYLEGTGSDLRTLTDLIEFNKQHADKIMPYFGQEVFEAAQQKGGLDSEEYVKILRRQGDVRAVIDTIVKENKLDAICGVTCGIPGAIDIANGDYDTGFYFGTPAASAGYPHISVPMGKVLEMPVGFSFMSEPFCEAELLAMAYAFEQASRKREPPKFLPTTIPA